MELMTPLLLLIFLVIIIPGLIILIDFLALILGGQRITIKGFRIWESLIMAYPVIFLLASAGETNDCCTDSATFSPGHRLSIDVLVACCMIAYFYSSWKRTIAAPVVEVITNCLLLTGVILNIFVAIQIRQPEFWLIGNVPVIILFIFALMKNHQLAMASMNDQLIEDAASPETGRVERFCRDLLRIRLIYKIPILLILCLPVLVILAGILMLFGQRPDSMIRAFTDTYKHGLSQLDDQCKGVVCGGHFLCTIAARGHAPVVQPIRSGIRGGQKIVCNRQLLISNAFEELLEKNCPWLHRPIRRLYNRIGRKIHRHYGLFDNKWISDGIYVLMKPLEWFFLVVLYTFDARPENRIAQQYLSVTDRQRIVNPANSVANL